MKQAVLLLQYEEGTHVPCIVSGVDQQELLELVDRISDLGEDGIASQEELVQELRNRGLTVYTPTVVVYSDLNGAELVEPNLRPY